MSKRFETKEDLERQRKAIDLFCKKFLASYKELEKWDIDYIVTKDEKICYVEVKGRNKNIQDAFPLPVAARKIVKLCDKKTPAIIIWACYDGLIYANIKDLISTGRMGGRDKRKGSSNDQEYMLYFDNQDSFFTINN